MSVVMLVVVVTIADHPSPDLPLQHEQITDFFFNGSFDIVVLTI